MGLKKERGRKIRRFLRNFPKKRETYTPALEYRCVSFLKAAGLKYTNTPPNLGFN